jgi:hypothetical protein
MWKTQRSSIETALKTEQEKSHWFVIFALSLPELSLVRSSCYCHDRRIGCVRNSQVAVHELGGRYCDVVTPSIGCCLTQANVRVSGGIQDVANDAGQQLRVATGGMIHNVDTHRMKVEVMRVFVVASETARSANVGHRGDGDVLAVVLLELLLTLFESLLKSCSI